MSRSINAAQHQACTERASNVHQVCIMLVFHLRPANGAARRPADALRSRPVNYTTCPGVAGHQRRARTYPVCVCVYRLKRVRPYEKQPAISRKRVACHSYAFLLRKMQHVKNVVCIWCYANTPSTYIFDRGRCAVADITFNERERCCRTNAARRGPAIYNRPHRAAANRRSRLHATYFHLVRALSHTHCTRMA